MQSGGLSLDEKRKLEAKITQLEEELDDEQGNYEISLDKQRKAQLQVRKCAWTKEIVRFVQVEQLTTELSMERSLAQKTDAEKQALERQLRELKNKVKRHVKLHILHNGFLVRTRLS